MSIASMNPVTPKLNALSRTNEKLLQELSTAPIIQAMKICSLLPSGTEILYALGLEDSIAGVSDLCDYPPRVKEKPTVSRSKVDPSVLSSDEVEQQMLALLERGEDPYELDLAWLERESPDVILTQDLCHVCEIDADGVNATVRGMQCSQRWSCCGPPRLARFWNPSFRSGKPAADGTRA